MKTISILVWTEGQNVSKVNNTVQWLFDFKQFDWFGGHRLSAHILVIDYIWKTHVCDSVM